MRFFCRNKCSDLTEQRNQGRLPQICGFSTHIGPCDNQNLILLIIKICIVRDEAFGWVQKFNAGVTSFDDLDAVSIMKYRTVIIVRCGNFSQRRERIGKGQ